MLFFAAILSLIAHEWAHAAVALACGDYTPRDIFRNPLRSVHWLFTLALPLALFLLTSGHFVFGTGKPVPIAYRSLRPFERVAVAGAGVMMNALICFVALFLGFSLLAAVNAALIVFNLIPFPLSDGWHILHANDQTQTA